MFCYLTVWSISCATHWLYGRDITLILSGLQIVDFFNMGDNKSRIFKGDTEFIQVLASKCMHEMNQT